MKKNNSNMIGIVSKEGYEAVTGARALGRAGQCSQLKGVVHEIMFCDKYNATPTNVLQGNHAALTQSTTARMKDVVMTNNGRVVGHAQLKDTISPSGIRKTIEQINGGHYGKTTVIGTEETVERIAGKVGQRVRSSGISSETTSRIADKALGRMPTASTFGAAAKGGITGAISAGAGTTAAGLTGAAVTSLASTGVGAAVAGTALGATAVAAAPLVVGFGAACAVGSFISSLFD